MPPPCGHAEPRIKITGRFVSPDPPMGAPGYCGMCVAAATDMVLRKRWGLPGRVLTLKSGVLPEPAAKGKAAPVAKTVLRPLPCVDLGKLVKRAGCRSCPRDDTHLCDNAARKGQRVTQDRDCEHCAYYAADG